MTDINKDPMNQDLHRGHTRGRGEATDLGEVARERDGGFDPEVEYEAGALSKDLDYGCPEHPQAKASLRGERDTRPDQDDSVLE